MRLLVIGYGRMGKLVDQLSASYGFEVALQQPAELHE